MLKLYYLGIYDCTANSEGRFLLKGKKKKKRMKQALGRIKEKAPSNSSKLLQGKGLAKAYT